MPEICKSCKAEYEPEDKVCKACGIVCDDTTFSFDATGHSSYLPSTSSKFMKRRTRQASGLKFGMENLDVLCNTYTVSPALKEEVSILLKKIHSMKAFHVTQDVGVMAGVCLIHVLRRHDRYLSINDLCRKLKCSKKSIAKCFKIIKMLGSSSSHSLTPSSGEGNSEEKFHCDAHLHALETSVKVTVEAIPEEDEVLLKEKTTELVKLAFSLWLGTGKSMEGLVVASAFLCWKSMHPSRRNVTFTKFCRDFSIDGKKAKLKISELNEMLLKLGQKIPSLTENYVTEKNVLFHLDYILKNSTTLRNDINSEEFDSEEISKKEFTMFRKPPKRTVKNIKIEDPVTYDSSFCASDVEISDTEIDSYIRSAEHVKFISALRDLKTDKEEQVD